MGSEWGWTRVSEGCTESRSPGEEERWGALEAQKVGRNFARAAGLKVRGGR